MIKVCIEGIIQNYTEPKNGKPGYANIVFFGGSANVRLSPSLQRDLPSHVGQTRKLVISGRPYATTLYNRPGCTIELAELTEIQPITIK